MSVFRNRRLVNLGNCVFGFEWLYKNDTRMYTGSGEISLRPVASRCSCYLHWVHSRDYKWSRERWTLKSLWVEIESVLFSFVGVRSACPIVLPKGTRIFPFITPREGPAIQQREWREKKEKNQKEREGGPGAMMFLFPCWRAPTICRWWGNSHAAVLPATSLTRGCRGSTVMLHTVQEDDMVNGLPRRRPRQSWRHSAELWVSDGVVRGVADTGSPCWRRGDASFQRWPVTVAGRVEAYLPIGMTCHSCRPRGSTPVYWDDLSQL
jgi:hypothetical protein